MTNKKFRAGGDSLRAFYMKELTVSSPSSFILCCIRWLDMAVIWKYPHKKQELAERYMGQGSAKTGTVISRQIAMGALSILESNVRVMVSGTPSPGFGRLLPMYTTTARQKGL